MTQTFRVRYDGSVLVPESPVDLPRDESLLVQVETAEAPVHGTAAFLMRERKGRGVDDADAERMKTAIEEACERTHTDPVVSLDPPVAGHEHSD